ncbi:putative vacuolar carboxypeptidase Cps1 [Aureobasidium melanogenum CBS 110374]|uniref:Putative vacuolar carboxypeptidase Cps1 n=1 Tax=Aureobasidium melanogenum (strain CBS 110374) TaxID=1043003 RepID=A0A074VMM3_AURM1|nr:putative vacuolar carboxypeptidase Cps1 [Aureobasidium melanogenum CBS 110374]KEQ58937.1 putative vacuolar carboxypeptidase Cps1 [Aureobasidium melanogenum CBS 110374]
MRRKGVFDLPANGHTSTEPHEQPQEDAVVSTWCPVPQVPAPSQDGLISLAGFGSNKDLIQRQVERLSAAVNVPSISYDDNDDVDIDPRWHAFVTLHEVLKTQFPKVHEKMTLEKVNSYGLLYTLPGSSQDLKPLVMMAHLDVVPVPDPSKWSHPPFEAYFDGQWLWGRGAVDCKSILIGVYSAMERLLEQDFKNKRTIILSFGFDEETGGFRGAKHLADHLKEKYGENSIEMIVDEGGGMVVEDGVTYAVPEIAEKGFLDIVLTLNTPGGHSSAPPKNTNIGIMSRLIAAMEDHPFNPHIDEHNPFWNYLKCEVENSPKTVEPWLREALEKKEDFADRLIESRGDKVRWWIQTSQSVDIINGGIKDNQLPEITRTIINYRVLPSDKIDGVLKTVADVLAPLANNYSIAVQGPGYAQIDRGFGVLNISSMNILQPAPITPTGPDVEIWNVFAGSIRQVFENTAEKLSAKKVIPVGAISAGNTDTAHYWALTRNIYRFSPLSEETAKGPHTVDERVDMQAHLGGVKFYYELIRNMDSYTGS